MADIVQITDFTGVYAIPTNQYIDVTLQEVIDEYHDEYLYDLLGTALGTDFIADLDANGVPVTAKYIDIYNRITIDYNCKEVRNQGMKEMMIQFIYFQFTRKQQMKNTAQGLKKVNSNNSESIGTSNNQLTSTYNHGVSNAEIIQYYVCQNLSTYEVGGLLYKGNKFQTMMIW